MKLYSRLLMWRLKWQIFWGTKIQFREAKCSMKELLIIGGDIKLKKGDLELSLGSLVKSEVDLDADEFAARSKHNMALAKEISERVNTIVDRIPGIIEEIESNNEVRVKARAEEFINMFKEVAANKNKDDNKEVKH